MVGYWVDVGLVTFFNNFFNIFLFLFYLYLCGGGRGIARIDVSVCPYIPQGNHYLYPGHYIIAIVHNIKGIQQYIWPLSHYMLAIYLILTNIYAFLIAYVLTYYIYYIFICRV